MPLDVIMPALGMAQDSGVIVSWLKQPGDKVATGDPLFEVETDKATMEVEAQGGGYLTDVTVVAGEAAPVGQVIARISDTAEGSGDAPAPKAAEKTAPEAAMPKGREIIMPALGMAQDTGLLIAWRKAPGDKIGADDILFEVETDKSAVEVPCGVSGYVAALLAEAGEEIPVGGVVAIISDAKPDAPFARSAKGALAPEPKAAAPAPEKALAAKPDPVKPAAKPSPMRHDGKILASPKMRRLALEDLDILRDLPPDAAPAGAMATGVGARRLCAQLGASGFGAFCDRAAKTLGVKDPHALLSGFAAASLRTGDDTLIIEVIALSAPQCYVDPDRPWLGRAEPQAPDAPATLRIRDLRHSLLTSINAGPEDCPVLTLTQAGDTVSVTLECAADQLSAQAAVTLLTDFAGRMEQPLRHLL
jgi:biotin carboxyl carrier protein